MILASLARCFGSSTFLSGLVSIVLALFAPKIAGRELPGEVLAAVPLAVGWKEAKRREADVALYDRSEFVMDELSRIDNELDKLKDEKTSSGNLP